MRGLDIEPELDDIILYDMDTQMRIHAAEKLIIENSCRAMQADFTKGMYKGRYLAKESLKMLDRHIANCGLCSLQYKDYSSTQDEIEGEVAQAFRSPPGVEDSIRRNAKQDIDELLEEFHGKYDSGSNK